MFIWPLPCELLSKMRAPVGGRGGSRKKKDTMYTKLKRWERRTRVFPVVSASISRIFPWVLAILDVPIFPVDPIYCETCHIPISIFPARPKQPVLYRNHFYISPYKMRHANQILISHAQLRFVRPISIFHAWGGVCSEAVFPEPKKKAKSCLDLACELPFEEGASGSSLCPPRAKLDCFRADKFLPSELRGSRRDMARLDGGLLSSTINAERSLGVDEKVVACRGRLCAGGTVDFSPIEIWGGFSRKGRFCAGGSVGFSPGESWGGFSCKRESDNGDGDVRSRADAAQSQWVDRAP